MEPIAIKLAERIRCQLAADPDLSANITEKKMFGGLCFLLNGNMLCGPTKQGDLMLRVGKEREEEAFARPGARVMDFTGRVMRGFVFVSPESLENDEILNEWLKMAANFVASLPKK